MAYSDQLKDPRWQRKRLEILQRDNFTCLLCEDTRTTLAIHHLDYNGNPWDIPDSLLKTVCFHCHEIIHLFPNLEITDIYKQKSENGKCWECVVFIENFYIFLYLFCDSERIEIIKIIPNGK
jgi:hypothetical protein